MQRPREGAAGRDVRPSGNPSELLGGMASRISAQVVSTASPLRARPQQQQDDRGAEESHHHLKQGTAVHGDKGLAANHRTVLAVLTLQNGTG